MGVKVTDLTIIPQKDSEGNIIKGPLYASWWFDDPKTVVKSGKFAVGDLVKITPAGDNGKDQPVYYNGAEISAWVLPLNWYITQLTEGTTEGVKDRAVLGGTPSSTIFNIKSPINTKYLTLVEGGDTETKTDTLDNFEIVWSYTTGDGVWFTGSTQNMKPAEDDQMDTGDKGAKYHSDAYNPPDNAQTVKVRVTPKAQTKKSGNNDVEYWTGKSTTVKYNTDAQPPEKVNTFSVEIKDYDMTLSVINISDPRTDVVYFEIYDRTSSIKDVDKTGKVDIINTQGSLTVKGLNPDGEFLVRCRAMNKYNESSWVEGEWTDFQGPYYTIPSVPKSITKCAAESETSVRLEWEGSATADTYEIEYTDDKSLFDVSSSTSKVQTIDASTTFIVTGLASGEEYFFRIRAKNEQGESAWSEALASVKLGTKPEAPTTWSSSSTVIVGEELILYWVHNSEDGSQQTYANVEIKANGTVVENKKISYLDSNGELIDEDEVNGSYKVLTTAYKEGVKLEWRVRTAGVTQEFGEWSISRTVDIYAEPSISLNIPSFITAFPFPIRATAGPATQMPIGYYVSIVARSAYETVDNFGNTKWVNAGEQIYSKYINSNGKTLGIDLTPSDITLEDGQSYMVVCTVSMNSGLTAEASEIFEAHFDDTAPEPYASVKVDRKTYTAYIRPVCDSTSAMLAVYRREYDGSFTEIASGVTSGTFIIDPHPALDYARYRIVATSFTTGAIGYVDIPGQPVGVSSIIIQWDEAWTNFDVWSSDEFEQPAWNGSLLVLPYNIDVSESTRIDASLISYIGRSHPVSYYGTQVGETATWNTDIPKSDKDTLYALRRLAKWRGDVYVREPSGVGYWANIQVSFSQKHVDLTVPITLTITRVEGGA